MANEKRLEELKAARTKLELLAKAIVLVHGDSTARDILNEVLDSTADGTGTDTYDLVDMMTLAFAHSNARAEVEERSVSRERAA